MSQLFNALNFNYYILKRMVAISPRKSKKIKMFYIEYLNSMCTPTQLGIKYKFGNAIWFAIDNKKTTANTLVIQRQEQQENLTLNVYGFFRKSTYVLNLKPDRIQVTKMQS